MIKNWKSQRWQTLLRFNSKRRLLITGTPLQNDLMELWSLMHFLMPHVFASHAQFKDWFSNPLSGAVESGEAVSRQLVERLHGVLRPFLLRRLKSEVERQMPAKHEHVLYCRLSKRQRLVRAYFCACCCCARVLASLPGAYLCARFAAPLVALCPPATLRSENTLSSNTSPSPSSNTSPPSNTSPSPSPSSNTPTQTHIHNIAATNANSSTRSTWRAPTRARRSPRGRSWASSRCSCSCARSATTPTSSRAARSCRRTTCRG